MPLSKVKLVQTDEAEDIEKRAKRGRPRGMATQTVYEALRDEILTLALRPGQYLDETQLEKRFGVSRTPIREALIRLQSERLVQFSANRGHFVELVNIDEVPSIFEALDLYQAAVFRLTAQRHAPDLIARLTKINEAYREAANKADHKAMTETNHAFHLAIGRACGNSFLAEGYETVLNCSIRLTYLMFQKASYQPVQYEQYYTQVYEEHREMIELIEARRKDELDLLSQRHIRLFCERISQFIVEREPLRSKAQAFFA